VRGLRNPNGERCHDNYAEPLRIRWPYAPHHVAWDWGRKWAAAARSRPAIADDDLPLLARLAGDDGTSICVVAIERDVER
jgi:hypothetical protein